MVLNYFLLLLKGLVFNHENSHDLVMICIYLNKRMLVEEPSDRIKKQNLYEDLEVNIIDCINVLKNYYLINLLLKSRKLNMFWEFRPKMN